MPNLFIIKPHFFNKISKTANGNYKNDYSVTKNFTVCFSLDVRSIVQTYYFTALIIKSINQVLVVLSSQ